MDPVAGPPPGFQIVDFSGPLLLSYLLHWGLFGALSVQLYLYYQAFPNDRLGTKCLVYIVYTIELVETILLTHDAFQTFGYGFGDISAPSKINLGWLDLPVTSGLVGFIGQSFYAHRLYVLSKSWLIPVLIVVVSLASSIGAFVTGAFSLEAGNFALLNTRKVSISSGVWNGGSALSDITIAVFMTYYLSQKVTAFRQTRAFVSKLMRLTVETGTLTAFVAITNFTLFIALPGRAYYAATTAMLPKLYANCILVVLNARSQIVGGRGTEAMSMERPSTTSYPRTPGMRPTGTNDAHMVTLDRDALSDAALHDHVEMKGLDPSESDIGTAV
ncbi:hypothetical protein FB451DRAFT_1491974 [Mycena latifolia]|nr:hypothetical protein FB451DRAFT_1491974 [Mycena latifolia]